MKCDGIVVNWVKLDLIGLKGLNWAEFGRIGLNWVELDEMDEWVELDDIFELEDD